MDGDERQLVELVLSQGRSGDPTATKLAALASHQADLLEEMEMELELARRPGHREQCAWRAAGRLSAETLRFLTQLETFLGTEQAEESWPLQEVRRAAHALWAVAVSLDEDANDSECAIEKKTDP